MFERDGRGMDEWEKMDEFGGYWMDGWEFFKFKFLCDS